MPCNNMLTSARLFSVFGSTVKMYGDHVYAMHPKRSIFKLLVNSTTAGQLYLAVISARWLNKSE